VNKIDCAPSENYSHIEITQAHNLD